MGYEPRGIDPGPISTQGGSSVMAFNDVHITEYVYGDTAANLQAGMPVYSYVLDAGEYNKVFAQTAVTGSLAASGGIVTTGTNANAVNLVCVGIYWPESGTAFAAPPTGSVIRVYDRGVIPVLTTAKAAGTAVLVGDYLIADSTPGNYAISGHNTPVLGKTIGQALITGAAGTVGASIIAVPGSGATVSYVNCRIKFA